MSAREPRRWLDPKSGSHPNLRALLQSGHDELPSPQRLAAIAAQLDTTLAAPGPRAVKPGGPRGLLRIVLTGTLLASLGSVAYVVRHSVQPAPERTLITQPIAPTRTPTPTPAPTVAPREVASTIQPAAEMPDRPAKDRSEHRARVAHARDRAPQRELGATPDPVAELALLDAAQAALRDAPERALAHAEEHAARFPHGEFEQEREILAIDALLQLDRWAQAERRAVRFLARYSGSSYAARARVLSSEAARAAPAPPAKPAGPHPHAGVATLPSK